MKGIYLLVALLGLTGCVTETKWGQEGKTALETEDDYFQCEDTLLREHNQFKGLSSEEIDNLMAKCMKSKGYHDKGE